MSILTDRDLEFLACLKAHWRRYYLNEVARLLKEDGNRCDNLPEAPFINPQSRCERGFNRPRRAKLWKTKTNAAKKAKRTLDEFGAARSDYAVSADFNSTTLGAKVLLRWVIKCSSLWAAKLKAAASPASKPPFEYRASSCPRMLSIFSSTKVTSVSLRASRMRRARE
jgi:hypothetical protein